MMLVKNFFIMPGMHHLRVILQKETSSQKGYIFKIIVAFMKHINKVKIITGKRKKKILNFSLMKCLKKLLSFSFPISLYDANSGEKKSFPFQT